MMQKEFQSFRNYDPNSINFHMRVDGKGRNNISMTIGPNFKEVAIVSPACVTQWPRCTGDGNFGTMWGPTEVNKAKFTLDLTDSTIGDTANGDWEAFSKFMTTIDDKLLDLIFDNQLKILKKTGLSREQVKMVQIRSVREKTDKLTGGVNGHAVQLNKAKFAWDGLGGSREQSVSIVDMNGVVVNEGTVAPGDVVATTMYPGTVYTGVGGDKFGIQWTFDDVQIVCPRSRLEKKETVSAFSTQSYSFAAPYEAEMIAVQ